jgi:hypothetical protein
MKDWDIVRWQGTHDVREWGTMRRNNDQTLLMIVSYETIGDIGDSPSIKDHKKLIDSGIKEFPRRQIDENTRDIVVYKITDNDSEISEFKKLLYLSARHVLVHASHFGRERWYINLSEEGLEGVIPLRNLFDPWDSWIERAPAKAKIDRSW